MTLLAYLFILAFFPVAYRLRGSGLIGNFKGYLAWSATVWVGVFMLTVNPLAASLSALGAFAGKWIGHSEYYQVRTFSQFAMMTAIHCSRFILLTLYALSPVTIVTVGVSCAFANAVACYFYDKKIISDMLKYAEPAIGFFFGVGLIMVIK